MLAIRIMLDARNPVMPERKSSTHQILITTYINGNIPPVSPTNN